MVPQGHIAFVGALPPPVHGMALANVATISALEQAGYRLTVHNISPHTGTSRLTYHSSRVRAVISALAKLIFLRSHEIAYLPIDGGLGLIYDVIFGILFRSQSRPIVVHHHNFTYINRPNRLMRLFLLTASNRQLHVFLCEEMRSQFEGGYRRYFPNTYSGIVLPNSFMFSPPAQELAAKSSGRLVIGHLSNLSLDKGTDLFLDLFENLTERGISARALLAGPLADPKLKARIALIQERHGERFSYLGPVYGIEKANFFADVDVFVFPTRYLNEAQPLVLLEALAAGCALATTARGCIACDYGETGGLIAADTVSFVAEAADWICALALSPARLRTLSDAASAHARQECSNAVKAKQSWLNAVGCLHVGN